MLAILMSKLQVNIDWQLPAIYIINIIYYIFLLVICNYFLFDTKGKNPGGNGIVFNWEILKKYKSQKPLFLSGGIGEDEIKIINGANLPIFAIDLNSKFEIEPGLKNVEKLKKII